MLVLTYIGTTVQYYLILLHIPSYEMRNLNIFPTSYPFCSIQEHASVFTYSLSTNQLFITLPKIQHHQAKQAYALKLVVALWVHCMFIPADWGSQQQNFAMLALFEDFQIKNDLKCKSICLFFLKINNEKKCFTKIKLCE